MKSCAKFITETLRHVQRDSYSNSPELYRLQQVLDRFLAKPRRHVSVQTDEPLEIDLMRLHIGKRRTALDVDQTSIFSVQPIPGRLYYPSRRCLLQYKSVANHRECPSRQRKNILLLVKEIIIDPHPVPSNSYTLTFRK